jgi:membrane protease YdiL (CAAX protease family)
LFGRIQAEPRARLLFWGGLLLPVVMILLGTVLAWLRDGALPLWFGRPQWERLAWAPLVTGISLGMVSLLAKLWPGFGRTLKQSGTAVSSEALRQVGYPTMVIVVSAAALGEEFLFRGGLQPWLGPAGAALAFGFSHGGWRIKEMWAYVLAASLSGLLFGLYYAWAGAIWAPVLAHLLHNVTALLLLGKRLVVSWRGGWPWVQLVEEEEAAEPGAPEGPVLPADPAAVEGLEEAVEEESGSPPPALSSAENGNERES